MVSASVIKVDISSQSPGIIRSKTDNVPVTTIVSGRITWLTLKNNVAVNKGDTLIKIAKESLITEKKTQDTLQNVVSELLGDISNLLKNKTTNLQTSTAREEWLKYKTHKDELQSKVSQTQINYIATKFFSTKA